MVGLFYPESPDPIGLSLINRSLAVVTFWLTAFGGLAVRRSAALRATNERLLAEIEDRKRAEAQVREQASLLDIAHDAISVRDLDDRIVYWNRGAERLYGWRADEVIGQSAVDLFDPRLRRPTSRPPAGALLERGEWTGAARHATKDGREVLVETRWTLVRDDAGRPRAKLVVNTDVTERRRLEAQVLRTQRLESIGVLAGGIAHDFNNLLTPMLMAVKLLREDRPADERAGLLATLQAGAERGAELVRKLLSFAGGGGGERGPVARRGRRPRDRGDRRPHLPEVDPAGRPASRRSPGRSWPTRPSCRRSSSTCASTPATRCRTAARSTIAAADDDGRSGRGRPAPGRAARATTSGWRSPTPGPASRPTSWTGCSTRSSRPSGPATGPGWGCPPSSGSSAATAGS